MRDSIPYYKVGIANLHPTEGTHWVTYKSEKDSDP